ncbi:DUF4330 domain-containing protein [bacterium]|nr:DUF4330 domain-containing protein [bacterium]
MEMFKKFKITDYIILALIFVALLVGFVTLKGGHQTASKQIEATSNISFTISLRGVSYSGTDLPIKAGEKAFITIRNVPYTSLSISDVQIQRRKQILPVLNGKSFVTVDDASMPGIYDVFVVLNDTAKITKDGAVVGGNKIKIGLPITIEGKDYRFSGMVSDLKIVHLTDDEQLNKSINSTDDDVQ